MFEMISGGRERASCQHGGGWLGGMDSSPGSGGHESIPNRSCRREGQMW